METKFMKGCEAVAETAVRAGCRYYAGYPITPQNAVPEYLAWRLPEAGGVFMQAESEIAAINMIYGAACSGKRVLLTSASCGISLMSETMGWIASANLPTVIFNYQRGGPGIGDIGPCQQDYNQATKAHGNGGFRMLVIAPSSLQETVDKLYEAWDLAEKYRATVYFLMDGISAGLMESVVLPEAISEEMVREKQAANQRSWALGARKNREFRVISGGEVSGEPLQNLDKALDAKYKLWEKDEVEYETYLADDAEIIITAYGVSARFARSAVNTLRAEGYKVGMIRPIKVYPFPNAAYDGLDYSKVRGIVSTEMSIPAMFVDDVKAAVQGRAPVESYSTSGGVILDTNEIIALAKKMYGPLK